MKKSILIFAAAAAFAGAVVLTSCERKEIASIPEVTVQVNLPEGFSSSAVYSGEVSLTDKATGKVKTVKAENSVAVFKKVPYGAYTVTASASLTNEEFKAQAPEISASVTAGISLNSNPVDAVLSSNEDASEPIVVNVAWSIPSSLVISRIYNFGTLKLDNKAYNIDKYIEIYNNSSETQYVDGLYLGEAYGSIVSASPYANIATGNFCYVQRVVRIPGNGTQYPVEPGKSIVIAQNAKNHIDAEVVTNTVDLSGADFECYVEGALASQFPSDNADVPNIEEVFGANKNAARFFGGQGTVPVLFRMTETLFTALNAVLAPGTDAYGDTYAFYCKPIAASDILDAVDGFRVGFENRGGPHVPAVVDASGALFNQKNITLRKIAYYTPDGRAVLQDTNNSSKDFVIVESTNEDASILVPRKYDVPQIQPGYTAE